MNGDKAFDDFLSIDTMECIGAERPTEDNNIYQATYYRIPWWILAADLAGCCSMATPDITVGPLV